MATNNTKPWLDPDLVSAVSGSAMATNPTGAGKVGRPANGSGDIAGAVAGMLKPELPATREEVLEGHPALKLDEVTQNMLTAAGKAATSMASGVLNDDTIKQISRISAEKALRGGLGATSQAARNMQVRDLGLTTLDLQRQGIEAANNLGALAMDFAAKKAAYLTDMRKLDLSAAELRMKSLQFDREEQRARFSLMSQIIDSYHNTVYKFRMTRGDSQGSIDDASEDFMGILQDMKKTWGMKRNG